MIAVANDMPMVVNGLGRAEPVIAGWTRVDQDWPAVGPHRRERLAEGFRRGIAATWPQSLMSRP